MRKTLLFLGIYLAAAVPSFSQVDTVYFRSGEHLKKALAPHTLDEVNNRIAESSSRAICTAPLLRFECAEDLQEKKIVPLRNQGVGNLIENPVFERTTLSVYYPETPRVPHHLTIALRRENVHGISDITEEENEELFSIIKKITEIYRTISIEGFVIAQYDKAQQGHQGRYVVEIIPHFPGFNKIKNMVDKVDCNRHVLFRDANLSFIINEMNQASKNENIDFWKEAFQNDQRPLSDEELAISFPHKRYESHRDETGFILQQHLIELLQDKGASVSAQRSFQAITMPTQIPEELKTKDVESCPFCNKDIVARQLVFAYENVLVFYNIRKVDKPGCAFLLLPTRHTEKVYTLTPEEIHNMGIVRRALVEVLRDVHPERDVVIYTQDAPSVGQTVFHSHEQIVSNDPKTIALSWTLMSLYPNEKVSDEEMEKVREEFRQMLKKKIEEIASHRESA